MALLSRAAPCRLQPFKFRYFDIYQDKCAMKVCRRCIKVHAAHPDAPCALIATTGEGPSAGGAFSLISQLNMQLPLYMSCHQSHSSTTETVQRRIYVN